jgi:hypothetical protein
MVAFGVPIGATGQYSGERSPEPPRLALDESRLADDESLVCTMDEGLAWLALLAVEPV